ncbi:MAG TPA: thioredoxin domain-containing protein [Candidatus Micrarchaeota archaeon]|nr:thioredoxin domain-containing protein [Candidatus Micrarchaeota archaeon]
MKKSIIALAFVAALAGLLAFGCAGIGSASGGSAYFDKDGNLSQTREVTLDFLHADWCPHCQNMKPIVARLIDTMPKDRFLVRAWNEKDQSTNPEVQTIYNNYTSLGYFQGFPTFVIGNDYRVGEVPESEMKAWVCSKFKAPLPDACKN